MNRRNALKNIGLSLGYTAIVPSVLSILQSCTTEEEKWVPLFLSLEESTVIKNLIDLILPKTETIPGALDVNVPEFIDLLIHKSYVEEDKIEFRNGMNAVMDELASKNNPEFKISDLKIEDYDTILSKYLRSSEEKKQMFSEQEILAYETITGIRNQSIWAFLRSEEIGENVLAYDPIPGAQKGCIDLNEATGGKAWSL